MIRKEIDLKLAVIIWKIETKVPCSAEHSKKCLLCRNDIESWAAKNGIKIKYD